MRPMMPEPTPSTCERKSGSSRSVASLAMSLSRLVKARILMLRPATLGSVGIRRELPWLGRGFPEGGVRRRVDLRADALVAPLGEARLGRGAAHLARRRVERDPGR